MIVRFTLTAQSLHLLGVEEHRRPKVLRKIVNIWGRLGRLVVFNGKDGERALIEELERLPQSLRKNWKTALERFQLTSLNIHLPEPNQVKPYLLIELAEFVEVIGCAPDEYPLIFEEKQTNPEVIFSSEIDEALAFANAIESSDVNIPQGTPTTTIWQHRLHPLIAASRKIIVIDRYCLKNFQQNNRYFESTGLRTLLKHLAKYSHKHLVIYAGYNDVTEGALGQQLSWQEVCSCLSQLNIDLNSSRQNRIEIKTIPESFFRTIHDRFMVFDYQVLELGSGLELLNEPETWRGMTSTLKEKTKEHDKLIGDLSLREKSYFKWSSHK